MSERSQIFFGIFHETILITLLPIGVLAHCEFLLISQVYLNLCSRVPYTFGALGLARAQVNLEFQLGPESDNTGVRVIVF